MQTLTASMHLATVGKCLCIRAVDSNITEHDMFRDMGKIPIGIVARLNALWHRASPLMLEDNDCVNRLTITGLVEAEPNPSVLLE